MARRARSLTGGAVGTGGELDNAAGPNDGGHSDGDSASAAAGGDSGPGGSEFVNPGSIAPGGSGGSTASDGPERVKRKYTKRSASVGTDKAQVAVGTIEKLLHSVHLGLSILTASPELVLSPDENSSMAKAISDVARHYPAFQASEKVTDWGNLIMCAAFIYGPRIIAVSNNKRARRVARAQAVPQAPAQTANGRAVNPQAAEQFTQVEIPGMPGKVTVPVDGWKN